VFGAVAPRHDRAAAAAGALAIKLGTDAVNAAIEDEKSLATLNRTLDNLEFRERPDRGGPARGFPPDHVRGVGRPPASRVRSAGAKHERRGRGGTGAEDRHGRVRRHREDLEAVTNALGKAYDGSTGALAKLGTGLDAAVIKSGDMQAITAGLSQTFGGQAAVAAGTFRGRLNILSEAASEASEQVGYALPGALSTARGRRHRWRPRLRSPTWATPYPRSSPANRYLHRAERTSSPKLDGTATQARRCKAKSWTGRTRSSSPRIPCRWCLTLIFASGTTQIARSRSRTTLPPSPPRPTATPSTRGDRRREHRPGQQGRRATGTPPWPSALGGSISFTGGTMQEWQASIPRDGHRIFAGVAGRGRGGSTTSAIEKVNPRLAALIALAQDHIDQLTGTDGYVANLNRLTGR